MCLLKKKKETFYQNVLEEPLLIGLLVAKEKELIIQSKMRRGAVRKEDIWS